MVLRKAAREESVSEVGVAADPAPSGACKCVLVHAALQAVVDEVAQCYHCLYGFPGWSPSGKVSGHVTFHKWVGACILSVQSPDGSTIASGSVDGTVLLWEFPMLTKAAEILADVNGDGVVNIQDVVLIAAEFGAAGEKRTDLNGDGFVNFQDLVLVANAFGNVAGAPSVHALSASQVEQWLRLAKRETSQSLQTSIPDRFSYERGIMILERLLKTLAPQRTVLLANYPNPFNPETWIPYQLAVPADVSISIYSANGQLVRTLALGHQPVGIYEVRSRAAYWDGKNTVGESVASGVYFYTLTAGDFTATRKMLILK